MNKPNKTNNQTAAIPVTAGHVLWKQLISLGTLYAAVIIGWIAYYNYQPKLLVAYNFTDLKLFLFIVQGIIMVITPPIAGRIGDQFRRKAGKRLPVITAGVSFAAMIFMATAFTLFTEPGPVFRWILPGLITLWLFSMSLFTSPAISTVELFVPANKLPTAMALLTVIYGLLYAIEPVITNIVDAVGPVITFAAGGVLVLLSGLTLKGQTRVINDVPDKKEHRKSDYTYTVALGIAYGWVTTVIFNLLPDWLTVKGFTLFGFSGNTITALFLVAVAVLSLPMGKLAEKGSVYLLVLISMLMAFLLITGLYFLGNVTLLSIMLGLLAIAYTIMSVSFLPLALTVVNDTHRVFGVGMFFAGFELPNSILEAVLVAQGQF